MAELTRKQIAGAMALRKMKEVQPFGPKDVEEVKPLFKTELQSQLRPLEPLPEPTPYVPQDIQDAPSSNPLEWLVNRLKGNSARQEEGAKRGAYERALRAFQARKRNLEAIAKNKPMDEAVLAQELSRQRRGVLPAQMPPLDLSQLQRSSNDSGT